MEHVLIHAQQNFIEILDQFPIPRKALCGFLNFLMPVVLRHTPAHLTPYIGTLDELEKLLIGLIFPVVKGGRGEFGDSSFSQTMELK